MQLASAPILNGIICATSWFSLDLGKPSQQRRLELPGRGQPHLAEHSLGQWYAVQTATRRSNVRDE